ncbi:hypothetical protein ACFY1L_53045 [Streptomyces sp. NPDC001663]|uniref:AMP-binding enzyme n=1 Tax=Streptomyces sp. NPDC001663 TaxID=3364597 RepID=UPI0036A31838
MLYGHPAVLETAVVGVPDPVYGEVPGAYVVTYPHVPVTADDLFDQCRQHLTKIKLPVEIHLTGALPKNPVGKIDKPFPRKSLQRGPFRTRRPAAERSRPASPAAPRTVAGRIVPPCRKGAASWGSKRVFPSCRSGVVPSQTPARTHEDTRAPLSTASARPR